MPCQRAGEGAGKGNESGAGAGVGDGVETVFVEHPTALISPVKWELLMMSGLMKKERGWRRMSRDVVQFCARGESC